MFINLEAVAHIKGRRLVNNARDMDILRLRDLLAPVSVDKHERYLQESYHQMAYQTLVYLVSRPLAPSSTRETLEATKEASRLVVECSKRKRKFYRGRKGAGLIER